MQIPVISSTWCLGGCPAVQLSLLPTQTVCNRITKCQIKQGKKCELIANILKKQN